MFSPRSAARFLAPPAAAALVLLGTAVPAAHATPRHTTPKATAPKGSDFNGDGYADLVVGVPAATVSGAAGAGYVVVMWGSAHGVSTTDRQVISRSTAGVPGNATLSEGLGSHVSSADLDGDGYADLVIDSVEGTSLVLWGGPKGLSQPVELTGYDFSATGDFNGDGRQDLLVLHTGGGGDEPLGTKGAIWDGPISRTGKPASTRDFGNEDTRLDNVLEARSGDINGDGVDDLALSVWIGQDDNEVQVYLGSRDNGPVTKGRYVDGLRGHGHAVALGDVNGDGYADIVAGVLDSGGAGKVVVDYGSADGVARTGQTTLDQNSPGVPGVNESEDYFGMSLDVADTNGDGYADVAVGVSGEALGDIWDAGAVILMNGSARGLTGTGAVTFTQHTKDVPGAAETGDHFGDQVRLLDTRKSGHPDFYATADGENSSTGAVWDLPGTANGPTATGSWAFGPAGTDVPSHLARFGTYLH